MTAEEIREASGNQARWIEDADTPKGQSAMALAYIHKMLAEIAIQLAELNAKKFINQE